MDSDARNECSHSLGFPIRKSPDHSLLAASRGLSQLTTSFFAFLRLGIHTHALSSLTITSTSYTFERYFFALTLVRQPSPQIQGSGHLLMPVNIQLSKISIASAISKLLSLQTAEWGFDLVGPGGIEPPTSPLSGVRSSHLSYGPKGTLLVELVGIEPATS